MVNNLFNQKSYLRVVFLGSLVIFSTVIFTQSYYSKKCDYMRPKKMPFHPNLVNISRSTTQPGESNVLSCYKIMSPTLPDIMDDESVNGTKSIFFHESSCASYLKGRISINARQACSVESAARLNPNKDVYILFTSPGLIDLQGDESDKMLKVLMEYKNVKIKRLDFARYVEGSPVEQLYLNGTVERSKFAMSHASDVLRYLTLWKYGGIYLDLDVVSMKTLEGYANNFAVAQSRQDVAAGALGFSSTGLGHELAKSCLDDLRDHFNGTDWAYNGPGTITRMLERICGTKKVIQMQRKHCQGFKVFPHRRFYPVPWDKWEMYFNENKTQAVLNLSKHSTAVHVWNNLSKKSKLSLTSKVAYMTLAKKYCPKVLEQCEKDF